MPGEKITAVRGSPLTANDRSSPRINPTTTNTNTITVVSPANVSDVRNGRRNRFRIAYSQGSRRKNMVMAVLRSRVQSQALSQRVTKRQRENPFGLGTKNVALVLIEDRNWNPDLYVGHVALRDVVVTRTDPKIDIRKWLFLRSANDIACPLHSCPSRTQGGIAAQHHRITTVPVETWQVRVKLTGIICIGNSGWRDYINLGRVFSV